MVFNLQGSSMEAVDGPSGMSWSILVGGEEVRAKDDPGGVDDEGGDVTTHDRSERLSLTRVRVLLRKEESETSTRMTKKGNKEATRLGALYIGTLAQPDKEE